MKAIRSNLLHSTPIAAHRQETCNLDSDKGIKLLKLRQIQGCFKDQGAGIPLRLFKKAVFGDPFYDKSAFYKREEVHLS